jgi:hypothetical protein
VEAGAKNDCVDEGQLQFNLQAEPRFDSCNTELIVSCKKVAKRQRLMDERRISFVGNRNQATTNQEFCVISFHLQSVLVHSENCVKTYAMACRTVVSSAPL